MEEPQAAQEVAAGLDIADTNLSVRCTALQPQGLVGHGLDSGNKLM